MVFQTRIRLRFPFDFGATTFVFITTKKRPSAGDSFWRATGGSMSHVGDDHDLHQVYADLHRVVIVAVNIRGGLPVNVYVR